VIVSAVELRSRLFSWFKKIFIGVFSLILFLLAVVFATCVVLQNNPSRLEVVLEAAVTRLLGRELQIGELLESELGLESYLLARDVTLANPEWAKGADFVRVGRVLVRVNLPSIWLDGPILIRELELADATVNLLTAQGNPANWDFWPDAPQEQLIDDASTVPHPVFPLRILTASVARGVLTFHSATRDIALLVGNLALSEPSEGGLVNLDFNGAVNDIPLQVTGRAGPTVALLTQRDLRMEVAVQLGELFLKSTGSIENLLTLSGPDLEMDIAAPYSRPLLKLLGVAGSANGSLNFKGRLTDADPGIAVQGAGVLNGIEVQLSGEVEDPLAFTGLQMELELHGPSISELGAMLGVSGLPQTSYGITGKLKSTPQGTALLDLQVHGPSSALVLDGRLGASPNYTDSHLNLELTGESQAAFGPWLNLHFLPATAFRLTGALDRVDSGWQLSEAMFSSDELQLKVGASVDQLPQPASLIAQLELSSANISNLLASYGVEVEGAPALPIAIQAVISGAPKSLEIEQMTAQSGSSRLKVSGVLGDLTLRENINLAVELNTENLRELLPPKGNGDLPAVPFQLAMKAEFSAGGVELNQLEASVEDAQLSGQITVADLKNPASARGNFKLEGPSSRKLIGLLGTESAFSDSNYLLEVGFNNSDDWLRLNPIALQWGKTDLSGSINFRRGRVVTIESDLYSKFVDMPSMIPSIERLEKDKAENDKSAKKSGDLTFDALTKKELADRVISTKPLDFSFLKRLQGSLKYTADEVYLDDEARSSMSVDFVLKDGLLSSRKLTWDGTFISGDSALSVRALEKGGEIDIRMNATRLPFLALLGGESKHDPNAQYRAHIRSAGSSWREMAKSANGAMVFRGGGGRMDNSGAGLILGDVFDQVSSRLNPFKETDRYTKIVCHAGALSIVDGKASIAPGAVMRSKKLDFAVGGTINLHNEKIDLVFSTRSRKGIGVSVSKAITPYFKLGGTLAYPKIVLDPKGVALSGGAAVATAGISILAEGLWDRWIATASNPCKRLIKQVSEQNKKVFRDLLLPVSTNDTIKVRLQLAGT
jgi:hypothetical protein